MFVRAATRAEQARQERSSHNAMLARGVSGEDLKEAFPDLYKGEGKRKANIERVRQDQEKFIRAFG